MKNRKNNKMDLKINVKIVNVLLKKKNISKFRKDAIKNIYLKSSLI